MHISIKNFWGVKEKKGEGLKEKIYRNRGIKDNKKNKSIILWKYRKKKSRYRYVVKTF